MVVCRFYVEGRCRFGENCRYEHPRGSAQRNLFGAGDDNWQNRGGQTNSRVTFQDQGNNPYKWSSNQGLVNKSRVDNLQTPSIDVISNLPKEMETWEKSKMWQFSCFSLENSTPCLPDLYDISFEELRTDAYHAIKNGNIQSYIEKIKKLEDEFASKRRHLKNMTMDTKQKLITFLDDVRRGITHKIFDPVQTIFGQSRITDSNSSGQLGGTNNSTGVFGASVFGSTNSGPGTFGSSTGNFGSSTGTFGSSTGNFGSSTGTFGSSTGTFGSSTGTFGSSTGNFGSSTGTFGRSSQPAVSTPNTNSSLFGGSDPSNSSFTSPSTLNSFGSSNSLPSGFSQQIAGVGLGSPTHQANDNFNANSQSNIFGGNQSGLFGSERNSSSNNPIGSFSNSQVSSQSSWLGKPQPALPSISLPSDLFGKNAQSTPIFGSASTNQASVFNTSISQVQASQAPNLFGKPSTQNVFPSMGKQNSQSSISSNTSSNSSKLYTPLTDLTDLEKEAFNAKAFQIGKIPLRPPPQELLNL